MTALPTTDRRDMGTLKSLKSAAVAAKEAYYGHKFTGDKGDLDAMVAFDVEEAQLMRAYSEAQDAYEDALKVHIKAETVAA
jgi:hypothetical protein